MRHKNPYVLLFGPSDDQGRLEVTREQLVSQAEDELRLAPMDFVHPEDDFDGDLRVSPLGRERIQAALAAYDTWSEVSSYPPGYRDALLEAARRLEATGDDQLAVDVVVE